MKHFIIVLFGLLLSVLLLEVFFRFLPVSRVSHDFYSYKLKGYPRLKPSQTILWSTGPLLKSPVRSRVNNTGFASSRDLPTLDGKKRIAFIGDSYVEALMIEEPDRIHSQIERRMQNKIQVDPLALSGAALSMYINYASFASEELSPCGYIFNIVSNDFDESMGNYRKNSAFPYFIKQEETFKLLQGEKPRRSFLRSLSDHSAFMRYLRFHLKPQILFTSPSHAPDIEAGRKATRAFLQLLSEIVPPANALFIVDADRSVFSSQKIDEAFLTLRNDFLSAANAQGSHTFDLQPVLEQIYLKESKHFQTKDDYHWNSYAHRKIADALVQSEQFAEFLSKTSCTKSS